MDENKYISKWHGIVHCPYCRGVIFRDYKKDVKTSKISFKTRCPHCKKSAYISIKIENGIVVQKEHE